MKLTKAALKEFRGFLDRSDEGLEVRVEHNGAEVKAWWWEAGQEPEAGDEALVAKGQMRITFEGDTLVFHHISFAAEHAGKGFHRTILRHWPDWLRAHGITRVLVPIVLEGRFKSDLREVGYEETTHDGFAGMQVDISDPKTSRLDQYIRWHDGNGSEPDWHKEL